MSPDGPPDRRGRVDRRVRPLPLWHPRRLRGRRLGPRRDDRETPPYLVDRVGWPVFLASAALTVLTLVDGALTVLLLDRGFEEANPLLRWLLRRGGPAAFFAAKYALTAAFLPVALVMNRYRLFGTRLRVGHLVPAAVALYLALIGYQLALWNSAADRPAHPVQGVRAGTFRHREN